MRTFLFESKQVGVLYHVCSLVNMVYNCENDSLSGCSYYGNSTTSEPVISFTRDRGYIVCTHADAEDPVIQLELNGDLLSEKYRTSPYNDWDYRGKIERVPDIKGYDADQLEEIGLPKDFDLYDVYYHPEKHGLKKGCYDRLYDITEYSIEHFKSWALRQRVLFDWCVANKVKVPYDGDITDSRPITDRQSEEIIVGDVTDLHKYIKCANFTVGDYFFTNTVLKFWGSDLIYDTLNNIRSCISYFKKWGIPTRFVKLDYTYKNSNHTRVTTFDLMGGLTDLSSLYSLYSRYLKGIENANSVLKSLKDIEEKYSSEYGFGYIIRLLVDKYKGDSVVSDSDLKDIFQYINSGVDFLKDFVGKEISDCVLWCGKLNARVKKPCDQKYINRYLFRRIVIPDSATVKEIFMSYDKGFYSSKELKLVKTDNHLLCMLFSFSGYAVYMQLL